MQQYFYPNYHQAALQLIGETPQLSAQAIAILDELERKRGIQLPASVREWYALSGAVSILSEYSNADHAVDLEHLGAIDTYWSGGKKVPIDLVAQGLLPDIGRKSRSVYLGGSPGWLGRSSGSGFL